MVASMTKLNNAPALLSARCQKRLATDITSPSPAGAEQILKRVDFGCALAVEKLCVFGNLKVLKSHHLVG